ncbi:hypothetical protein P9166_13200 (plasmid) [Lactococcus lactis]|nr:hypothetical protein P9166_13200 [Lactococcus lactis]
MARKKDKKKRQEEIEDALVAFMTSQNHKYHRFTDSFTVLLDGFVNELIVNLADPKLDTFAILQVKQYEAIRKLQATLIDYQEEFREMLLESMSDTLEETMRQLLPNKAIPSATDNSYLEQTIAEAYDYFEELFLQLLLEIESIAVGTVPSTEDIVTTIQKLRDRLSYTLRRHIEAQMAAIINLAVIEASKQHKIEVWKWCIRPELTESGTCADCLALSEGGIGNEGLYTLSTMPLLSRHPHCVCILIPYVL